MYMGNPEYGVELQDIDFAMVAEACGMIGLHVEQPGDVARVVKRALNDPHPALVEAVTDPYEPMIPGGMKPQLAEKYAKALRKGEPNSERIGITLFRETMEDFEENRHVMREALEKEVPEIAQKAEQSVAGGKTKSNRKDAKTELNHKDTKGMPYSFLRVFVSVFKYSKQQ